MRLTDLVGKRVVVWGSGREASAFLHATSGLGIPTVVLDEQATDGQMLEGTPVQPFSSELLRSADVVVRSPGVSIYRTELAGLTVTTPTNLWFAETHAPIIAITGTKGKSTTSSLVAHVLNDLGIQTRLAGNIGRSPLDYFGAPEPQHWVLELSSFQVSDLQASPDIAVLTSLDSDHLDWHGDQEHYVNDKLQLFANAKQSIVNVVDPGARAVVSRLPNVIEVDDSLAVPKSQLFGPHNAQLIRLALTVLREAGVDIEARKSEIAASIATFAPLPHRLEPAGEVDGVLYINDSLSTNPIAATAAVNAFVGRPISLLVGGYDRGLDFEHFGAFLSKVPNLHVFTMPDCGERIAATIADVEVTHTTGLHDAITQARKATPAGGVILLAPAAASFGHFKDYADRGNQFKALVAALSTTE